MIQSIAGESEEKKIEEKKSHDMKDVDGEMH